MSLREELESVRKQIAALEQRRCEIYAASLAAPAEEKICIDSIARDLSEPTEDAAQEPLLVRAMTVRGDVVGSSWLSSGEEKRGAWVAIRPCDEACAGKTFLGIYIGDVAMGLNSSFHRESGVLTITYGHHNPAIWVPDLKRIVFGAESWWGILKSPDDLRQITDADIHGIWYVQALKALSEQRAENA